MTREILTADAVSQFFSSYCFRSRCVVTLLVSYGFSPPPAAFPSATEDSGSSSSASVRRRPANEAAPRETPNPTPPAFRLPPSRVVGPGLRLRDHRLTGDRRGWIPRGRLPPAHRSPMPEGMNLRRQGPAWRGLRASAEVAASRFARVEVRPRSLVRRIPQWERGFSRRCGVKH